MYAQLAVMGVQALSTFSKLNAQKDSLKIQANLANQNATYADIQARDSIDLGRNQVTDYQRNLTSFKSSQINAMADNGIDVSQGSAIDVLASTEMMAQSDLDNIKYNAALESWGHQVEQTNYINEANSLRAQADSIHPLFDSLMSVGSSFAGSQAGGAAINSGVKKLGSSASNAWQSMNWNWFGNSNLIDNVTSVRPTGFGQGSLLG